MIKILTIDGGGSRGIIPITILLHLIELLPSNILDYFDYFSGSSVGVILLCILLLPNFDPIMFSFNEFKNMVELIFYSSFFNRIKTLNGFYGPLYDDSYKYSSLIKYFGNYTVNDLLKNIFIPIYDLKCGKCIFITKETFPNLKLIDLVMAATAAPSYFKPWEVHYDNHDYMFVDNGTVANNPCNILLSYIINKHDGNVDIQLNSNKIINNMLLVSIGTGIFDVEFKHHNWGAAYWMGDIAELFMRADSETELFRTRCLIGSNMYRLDINIPDNTLYKLDIINEQALTKLVEYTKNYLIQNKVMFDELLLKLLS